jgi:S-adenosylmethionine synthetase
MWRATPFATSATSRKGAGDQGMMFGFACSETPELMPAPIFYAHAILRSLAEARHSGAAPLLGPDAKSQVTLQYVGGKPVGAAAVLVSTQHDPSIGPEEVREIVRPHVVNVLPQGWMCDEAHFYINPTGRFVIGGPDGDCGLTGRKIIVDTYGGAAPHGGGAFSGKDPTKVDRSAAYAARYLAKNVVAAGLAERCTIQVAYAIGIAKPLSVYVETDGTAKVDEDKLSRVLQELMDLSPRGIRTHLGLNKPIYARTAAYGHFGRAPEPDGGFSWERLDLVDELRRAF